MRHVLALTLALAVGVRAAPSAPGARNETAAPGFPPLLDKCGEAPTSEEGCKLFFTGVTEADLHRREACLATAKDYKTCVFEWHAENGRRFQEFLLPSCERDKCPLVLGTPAKEVPAGQRVCCLNNCLFDKSLGVTGEACQCDAYPSCQGKIATPASKSSTASSTTTPPSATPETGGETPSTQPTPSTPTVQTSVPPKTPVEETPATQTSTAPMAPARRGMLGFVGDKTMEFYVFSLAMLGADVVFALLLIGTGLVLIVLSLIFQPGALGALRLCGLISIFLGLSKFAMMLPISMSISFKPEL